MVKTHTNTIFGYLYQNVWKWYLVLAYSIMNCILHCCINIVNDIAHYCTLLLCEHSFTYIHFWGIHLFIFLKNSFTYLIN